VEQAVRVAGLDQRASDGNAGTPDQPEIERFDLVADIPGLFVSVEFRLRARRQLEGRCRATEDEEARGRSASADVTARQQRDLEVAKTDLCRRAGPSGVMSTFTPFFREEPFDLERRRGR
jgi:hypothetical protein